MPGAACGQASWLTIEELLSPVIASVALAAAPDVVAEAPLGARRSRKADVASRWMRTRRMPPYSTDVSDSHAFLGRRDQRSGVRASALD